MGCSYCKLLAQHPVALLICTLPVMVHYLTFVSVTVVMPYYAEVRATPHQ